MTPSTAATSVAARVEIMHGGGGGGARRQARQASRPAVGRVAILALAVAAVASMAPVLLSEGAWAQTDESLGDFVENGTVVRPADNGSSTGNTYTFPRGLASDDSGRLIVADTGTPSQGGQRVVVLDNYVYNNITLGQHADYSTADGKFRQPQGVDVNSTGHIFVADKGNNRIQIFDSDGAFVAMFDETSSGKPILIDRNSTVEGNDLANFVDPVDVAISHDEKLIYVTDHSHSVYYFNASTYKYVGQIGNREAVDVFPPNVGIGLGTDVRYIKGQFGQPTGIDIGPGGLLAVAEADRHVVNIIDPADTRRAVADYTRRGFPVDLANNSVFLIGDTFPNNTGKPSTEEGLFGITKNSEGKTTSTGPRDVAFSKDGSLLAVTDPANLRFQVFQLDTASDGRATGLLHPDGKPAFVFNSTYGPLAVAFDSDDRLVVTEQGLRSSTLTVYDVTLPAVKNVTAKADSADPVLLPNGSIVVEVEFNTDQVRVNATAGMPYLAIGPEHNAMYVPYTTNTTDTLTFTYKVRDGDVPDDFVYDTTTALTLNGSTITAGSRDVTALTDLPNPDGSTDMRSLLADHGIDVDAKGPELVSVYSPNASATYQAGDRIEIVLNYDENATIIGPAPTLALEIDTVDGGDRFADYFRGNETRMLEFEYTVREGDRTAPGGLRYASTDALGLDGIQIQDKYGNEANRTLPAPAPLVDETGAAVDIAVDAMPPSVESVSPVADGMYRIGDTVEIAVSFDEPVNATGSPTLALDTDPPRRALFVNGSDGDVSLMFSYEVQEDVLALDGLQYSGTDALSAGGGPIVDAAGNEANLTLAAPGTPGYSLAGIIINGSVAGPVDQTGPGNGSTPGTGDGTPGTGDGGQNATLTCSIALGQSVSGMDVRPGERSSEAGQTVMNSGTAQFMAVTLEAMPWYADLPANTTLAAVQGLDPAPMQLPASLTEMRMDNATDAMYAALPANGTATVAEGLRPGERVGLSFVLDLTDQASAPGRTLTQFIEYTAECSGSQ